MLSAARNPKNTRSSPLQPILPLVVEKFSPASDLKSKYLTYELKSRVGQPETGTKYKKYVMKFEEGTPQQWIDLVVNVQEIWTQNSINGGTDKAATYKALLRGESLTAFEVALTDAKTDENGNVSQLSQEHVQKAVDAVANEVFPHRALDLQKMWMSRGMKKPANLSIRKTVAAVNRVNNALPLFPGGSEASKFSSQQIIEFLEWAVPDSWRAQFNRDHYVPTMHDKARFISECEAIERDELNKSLESNTKSVETKKEGKGNGQKKGKYTPKSGHNQQFFCKLHGNNPSHDTDKCFVLKKRAKAASNTAVLPKKNTGTFSNKAFRKEINMLSKKSSKKKVLDLYASVIQREQKKLATHAAKRKNVESDSDDDSDDSASVHIIEPPRKLPKKSVSFAVPKKIAAKATKKAKGTSSKDADKSVTKKKRASTEAESITQIAEEDAYQHKMQWLRDHGEPDKDHDIESDKEAEMPDAEE